MNAKLQELYAQAQEVTGYTDGGYTETKGLNAEKFAKLVAQECIRLLEDYRIPCGNSPAGELACDWTYQALVSIRDDIKQTFEV